MSAPRLFGTDGMRGRFGDSPLDEHTLRRLGAALGARLRARSAEAAPRVILGGDTRESTATIAGWLGAELAAQGLEVVQVGVLPTPGIAKIAILRGAACGIAVSASHNPWPDNGVKLIDGRGHKWRPEDEAALEEAMMALGDASLAGGALAPKVDEAAVELYLAVLRDSVPALALQGQRIALDLGNGAASALAGPLFEQLGAEALVLHAAPDGRNVNDHCGSTHPQVVAEVAGHGWDLGFSFDGDADRCLMADEKGQVRDGDAILYLWARDLAAKGLLPGRRIVATSMSNLGLEVALRKDDIALVRCDVGDRAVGDTMKAEGITLGGEQSGHIIAAHLATTGDGLLTALQIAALRAAAGRPLSELLAEFRRFPQILRSYKVARKPPLASLPAVVAAEAVVRETLGNEGRLVLRYSGTENLVRTMLEGPDDAQLDRLEKDLAATLLRELT